MKKVKLPGGNISLKTKKTEDPLVMQWLNAQSNLMDSLRYLVENEIAQNGVRNLQAFVPMERNRLQDSAGLPEAVVSEPPAYAAAATTIGAEQTAAASEAIHAPEPVVEEEIDDDDIEAWS
ncbi:hypothetical protein BK133_16875 [Paenibacillus sp. FSL H8-0548]|uniref:hypothetical protein n=1 Tax=Paenibacillus sp. FSL H8-0548 TaxID=1920422 RepID=UPI00096D559E|nr:hypothetical protein [Paenibacillus sp. FSL H8-0548]OMF30043.1 hypothetical protein BK133_16875 [Paenibacillus sp. FSL H8-0548]